MRYRAVAAIVFALVALACTASPALAGKLPVIYNGIYGYAHASPTASPPGPTTGRASRRPPTRSR